MKNSLAVASKMNRMRTAIFCLGIACCLNAATASTLQIEITPKVAGENLQPASLRYQTSAGETFSITRVSYLVSDFALQRNDGSWLEISNSVAWLDFDRNRNSIWLEQIPAGEFRTVRFTVGLDTNPQSCRHCHISRRASAQSKPQRTALELAGRIYFSRARRLVAQRRRRTRRLGLSPRARHQRHAHHARRAARPHQ